MSLASTQDSHWLLEKSRGEVRERDIYLASKHSEETLTCLPQSPLGPDAHLDLLAFRENRVLGPSCI